MQLAILILVTLAFLIIVLALRIKATTQVSDERFIGGGIPLGWWVFIVIGAALLAMGWVKECHAQTPDSIKTAIALEIIRVVQDEDAKDRGVEYNKQLRLLLVKGYLELYKMKLLTHEYNRARRIEMYKAKLRSRMQHYCPGCGFSHGRFYHAMQGKE